MTISVQSKEANKSSFEQPSHPNAASKKPPISNQYRQSKILPTVSLSESDKLSQKNGQVKTGREPSHSSHHLDNSVVTDTPISVAENNKQTDNAQQSNGLIGKSNTNSGLADANEQRRLDEKEIISKHAEVVKDEPNDDQSLLDEISAKLRSLMRRRKRSNDEFDAKDFLKQIMEHEFGSKPTQPTGSTLGSTKIEDIQPDDESTVREQPLLVTDPDHQPIDPIKQTDNKLKSSAKGSAEFMIKRSVRMTSANDESPVGQEATNKEKEKVEREQQPTTTKLTVVEGLGANKPSSIMLTNRLPNSYISTRISDKPRTLNVSSKFLSAAAPATQIIANTTTKAQRTTETTIPSGGKLDLISPLAHRGDAWYSPLYNGAEPVVGPASIGFLLLVLLFIYFFCLKWCCCCFRRKGRASSEVKDSIMGWSTAYKHKVPPSDSTSNSNNSKLNWLSSKLTGKCQSKSAIGRQSGETGEIGSSIFGFEINGQKRDFDDTQTSGIAVGGAQFDSNGFGGDNGYVNSSNKLNHKDFVGQTTTSASTGCLAANSRFDHLPTWAANLQKSSSFNNNSRQQFDNNKQHSSHIGNMNNLKSLMKFRNNNNSSTHPESNETSGSRGLRGNKDEPKLGRIKFKIDYDFNTNILSVNLIEGRDLAPMDLCGSSDPYVKVFLLPDKRHYEKTRVHKKTLNPQFNETFQFQINYADLINRTLLLMVYDHDRFSRHDTIGQATIPMDSLDLSVTREEWRDLKPPNDSNGSLLGDICLSLRYVPTAGKLNVVVLEARRLKKMDLAGLSDPYVKISLMSNGKRIKKKKTSVKKCTLNPHYNESFSFEIPFERIQQVQMVFTVIDYDRLGQSEPIGKIVLGCDGTTGDSERRHWMDMLGSPRRPIAQWHNLKEIDSQCGVSGSQASGKGEQKFNEHQKQQPLY